jgi:hypothetical protein
MDIYGRRLDSPVREQGHDATGAAHAAVAAIAGIGAAGAAGTARATSRADRAAGHGNATAHGSDSDIAALPAITARVSGIGVDTSSGRRRPRRHWRG